jgi:hypothetical protein
LYVKSRKWAFDIFNVPDSVPKLWDRFSNLSFVYADFNYVIYV